MTKPTDPYSRIYWSVRSDDKFRGIYADDHHFAAWVRLLIAADAVWPAPADVPAACRKASLQALATAGLIDLLEGHLFRVHGLDAERSKRQSVAVTAASARWPDSNARGSGEHPDSTPSGMPRARSEPSQAETEPSPAVGEDDLWKVYRSLTKATSLKPATVDWLDRLETTYGVGPTTTALLEEHAKDGNPGTLLGRVNSRLEAVSRKTEKANGEASRSAEIQARMWQRRIQEFRHTKTWRPEWGEKPAEVPA